MVGGPGLPHGGEWWSKGREEHWGKRPSARCGQRAKTGEPCMYPSWCRAPLYFSAASYPAASCRSPLRYGMSIVAGTAPSSLQCCN